MIPTLKAEFKKLLSVRSTYIISLLFLLLSCFVAFYVHGFKDTGVPNLSGHSPVDVAGAKLFLASSIDQIANVVSVAGALIGLLLLAHEYRYNTIVYTLTAANSRSKVLAAKIIAILGYVLVYSLLASIISLLMMWFGALAGGHHLPPQDINYLTFFAKCVFYSEAFALAGLLLVALIRNQIGAIAALFIIPGTVEGLLALLLKRNAVYLPFTALSQVVQTPVIPSAKEAHPDPNVGVLTPGKGALVFLAYLVVGWIIAWVLFLRRDAS